MAEWTHRYATINGLAMHYVEQGSGPLVILCHGFPHTWFSWRHQLPAIAAAGWRVVAPDMRGMGQTEAPADPAQYLDVWKHPPGATYLEALPETPPLPWPWLSDLELEVFVSDYARSGFTGGLNWYRAMDLRWEQRAPFRGRKNPVPFFFIGSVHDVDLEAWHGPDPIGEIANQYEDVRAIRVIEGAGHLMQMEKPSEVNAHILEFLATLR